MNRGRTGVFCTPAELETLTQMAKQARGPHLFTRKGEPLFGDMKKVAYEVNKLALKYGLPLIPGNYGITKEGEFTI